MSLQSTVEVGPSTATGGPGGRSRKASMCNCPACSHSQMLILRLCNFVFLYTRFIRYRPVLGDRNPVWFAHNFFPNRRPQPLPEYGHGPQRPNYRPSKSSDPSCEALLCWQSHTRASQLLSIFRFVGHGRETLLRNRRGKNPRREKMPILRLNRQL